MSKLAVFLIRLATDPDARDRFRDPSTRDELIQAFSDEQALDAADIKALKASDVSAILGAIAASSQQTDGTEVSLTRPKKRSKAKK